jgi:phosphatidate phosphatase APP1
MMLEIPLPNHTTQIHKLGPTEENGIVSQVINTGVRQVADGARVRSHVRGMREKAYMETTFAGPEGWLVVSDVDDTIKYTKTSDTTGILRTTFAEEPRPITGMPQLYSRIERQFEPTWFYLSASPYNLYPFLRGFLRDHFSPGTLILRDSSWLDISELVKSFTVNTLEYKVDRIRKIRRWFPHRRALCIGDSTQTDPEAYAEIYRQHPEWVHAILIRKVMDVPHMEEQNSPARFAEAFKGVPKHIWRVFEHPREVYSVLDEIRARENASFSP